MVRCKEKVHERKSRFVGLLLASLFVLGGDFWDKVRSLFIHDAEVRFAQVG